MIEESNADEGGDQRMLSKLDNGQEDLLAKRIMKKRQDDLLIEAVCANKPTDKKVGKNCKGYISEIQIPRVDGGCLLELDGSYMSERKTPILL